MQIRAIPLYFACFLVIALLATGCGSSKPSAISLAREESQKLYSTHGKEIQVSFEALYEIKATSLEEFRAQPDLITEEKLSAVAFFLYGPLVSRSLGSPLEGEKFQIFRSQAQVIDGAVMVPYRYKGTWLVTQKFSKKIQNAFPVPYQEDLQRTPKWKKCGDSQAEHQHVDWLWYFWDPSREGCDQAPWVDFQNVKLEIQSETAQTEKSYPEYSRMIHQRPGGRVLAMTFAFGYFNEESGKDPFQDKDAGMVQFRQFHKELEKILEPEGFEILPVKASVYGPEDGQRIGSLFRGKQGNVKVEITVVAAVPEVSHLQIFSTSFAQKKEAFFGWFGHSMVGSGYDLQNFENLLQAQPQKYSISQAYQIVYWNGCNSYSFFTKPLFRLKGGSRNLDILSNALPSFFNLNATQASILFKAFWNQQAKTSYQSLLQKLEGANHSVVGERSLVNVLGDEDNP
ncbi:MAG: hypothetical protein ACAH59_13145 [Pseudobdellovibrionaceae bacterium]